MERKFCFSYIIKTLPQFSVYTVYWLLSRFWLYVTLAHQAPLSVGFPRQEYWSGYSTACLLTQLWEKLDFNQNNDWKIHKHLLLNIFYNLKELR